MEDDSRLPPEESVPNPPTIFQNNLHSQFPISPNPQSFHIGNPSLENTDFRFDNGNHPSFGNNNLGYGHNMGSRSLAFLESQLQRLRIDGAARQQFVGGTNNYQQIPSRFMIPSNNSMAPSSFNNFDHHCRRHLHHHHHHYSQYLGRQGPYENPTSLEDARGNMMALAKDQSGSQFLMNKMDEGNPREIALILWEVKDHLHELMMHTHGNHVIQKMFEVISEEQMTAVVNLIILNEHKFVDVCVHTLGTRAIQKLVEHLRSPENIVEFLFALKINIVALAKVLNSGYVIQKCVMIFPPLASKEILDQIAFHCIEIGTHKDGCSVVQKCLAHANGPSMALLVRAIIFCAAQLADDPFGNYVVQFVIKMNNAYVNEAIVVQLRGKYVELSTNKFASNVVEDLLQYSDQRLVALIIQEIMNSPNFLHVLQNPFGNYVVQGALRFSMGALHNALWNKIMSNYLYLRSDPYGKRVLAFARGCRC